jgi:hypothetical protein
LGATIPIIKVTTRPSDKAQSLEPMESERHRWKPKNVKLLAIILLVPIIASPFGVNVSRLPLCTSWNISTVGHWGYPEASMAVDGAGHIHLVYTDSSGLVYAANSAGKWERHSFGFFAEYVSIAVDSAGASHVAATEYTSHGRVLTYMTDASGSWVSAQVNSPLMGWPLSIAVDASRIPHITYPTGTDAWANGELAYSTIVNGTWTTENIPFVYSEGWSSDIALDSDGNVHIVAGNPSVYYVTNKGGNWTIESVFFMDLSLDSVSIAVDRDNSPRITYFGGNSLEGQWGLQYAVRASNGTWVFQRVERVASMNWPSCSIAVDALNNAHIAYTNGETGVLKYVKIAGASMTSTTMDLAAQGLTSCSIGIDSQNRVDISYADASGRVELATNAPPPMVYHMVLMASVWKCLACTPVILGYALWYFGRRRTGLKIQEGPPGEWRSSE